MNRITMAVWGLTIFAMCFLILAIGFKQDKDYAHLTSSLKDVTEKYIKDNNISIKLNNSSIVLVSDLINEEYIEEDEKIDEYCIKSVVVTKRIFGYKYEMNIDCKKEENNKEE